jgi:hypothetical protein
MTEQRQDRAHGNGRGGAVDQTFAKILGERWRASGEGIYTLVEDDDPETEPIDDPEAGRARPEFPGYEDLPPVRRWLRRGRE